MKNQGDGSYMGAIGRREHKITAQNIFSPSPKTPRYPEKQGESFKGSGATATNCLLGSDLDGYSVA